jgi:hypothetical protein
MLVDEETAPTGGTKGCPKCGLEKPLDEFSHNQRRKDGRSCWCRSCCRAY